MSTNSPAGQSPAPPSPTSIAMSELNKLTFQSTLLSVSMIPIEQSIQQDKETHTISSTQSPSSISKSSSPRAARLDAISSRIRAEIIDLESPIDAIVAARSEVDIALKRVKSIVSNSSEEFTK
jgi:hypothetical protein